MGQMLQQVVRGNKFRPVTVKDVVTAVAKNASKVLLLFATSVRGGKPHQGLHASLARLTCIERCCLWAMTAQDVYKSLLLRLQHSVCIASPDLSPDSTLLSSTTTQAHMQVSLHAYTLCKLPDDATADAAGTRQKLQ